MLPKFYVGIYIYIYKLIFSLYPKCASKIYREDDVAEWLVPWICFDPS